MSFRDSQIIKPVWPFALNHNSPQAQGLAGWWPMAHPGGKGLFDFSGNGNDGALINGPVWTDSALAFDGVNDYVNIPNSSSLESINTLGEVTAAAWVRRLSGVAAVTYGGFIVRHSTGSTGGFCLQDSGGHQGLFLVTKASGGSTYVTTTSSFNNGVWHLIVGTYDRAGALAIFFDGMRQATGTLTGALGGSGATTYIGSDRLLGGRYFNAEIGPCALWNRALSPAEVFALYDPQTRYDLYWELGRRAWSIPPPADQTVEPNAISQTVSVPNPTVAPGQVTIAPSLLTQSVSVPQPTIAPGGVIVAPDVISQGVAMQQPTIAPGAVTVAPSLLTQAISIPNPTVGQAGGGAALALSDAAVTLVTVSDTLLTV